MDYKDTKVIFLYLIITTIINNQPKVLKNFGDFLVHVFQKSLILLGKWVWGVGVNVYLSNVFTVLKKRDYNFGLNTDATCYVVILGLYIGHYEIFIGYGNLSGKSLFRKGLWYDL